MQYEKICMICTLTFSIFLEMKTVCGCTTMQNSDSNNNYYSEVMNGVINTALKQYQRH